METVLVRDCSATMIPAGDAVTLPKGTEVFITQSLGGNVTVRARGALYRISSLDTDALEGYYADEEQSAEEQGSDASLEERVWAALRQCFDPEIPINIVDLGLIYDLSLDDAESGGKQVRVKMTLTAQGCGMGPVIADDARMRIESIDGVQSAEVEIVWDPVWNPQMISPQGRQILGIE